MTAVYATGIGISNTGLIFTAPGAHITDTDATTGLACASAATIVTAYCAVARAREILKFQSISKVLDR
jgi:hypothetical protein